MALQDMVIQVYNSEAAARLGDVDAGGANNALAVTSDGIIKSNGQVAGYGFWTHTKYWYRIEANEPVKEFYIDWDDGEDNNPKSKANYTSIKFDTPQFVGVTNHIYTGNNSTGGKFYPRIRVKSVEGYWSKFYTHKEVTTQALINDIDLLQGHTALAVGRNNNYRIEADVATERIPAFQPSPKPPVGILKTDKKRVYAGIDNGYLRGTNGTLSDVGDNNVYLVEIPNNDDRAAATATVTITDYTQLNAGDKVNLVATDGTNYDFTQGDQSSVNGTWEATTSNVTTATNLRNVINTSSGPSGTRFTATNSAGSSNVVTITQETVGVNGNTTVTLTDSGAAGMSNTNFTGGQGVRTQVKVKVTYQNLGEDGATLHNRGHIESTEMSLAGTYRLGYITKILKVELLDLLEDSVDWTDSNAATGKLYPGEKMALVAGAYSDDTQQTLAEVSLGNPIITLDDPKHTVTYDLTESFARTPEQSVTNYFIDDGKVKVRNGFAVGDYFQQSGHSLAANTDTFLDANGVLETSSGIAKRNYAFDVGYHYVDDDGRWLPKQILARGQIKVDNPIGTTALHDQQYSSLEHWRHEGLTNNYNSAVNSATVYNYTSDMTSSGILALKSSADSDRWTDLEDDNRKVGEETNFIIESGSTTASAGNRRIDASNGGNIDHPTNNAILVCARDKKWTKQYWKRCYNNNAENENQGKADMIIPGSTASGGGISTTGRGHMQTKVELFYTGYESDKSNRLMWKPLKYLNNTKHPDYDLSTWYVDGTFEWEEPDDWVAVNPDDIPDEFYPRGDYYTTSDTSTWAYTDELNDTEAIQEIATIDIDGASYNQAVLSTPLKIEDKFQSVTGSGTLDLDDGLAIILEQNAANLYGKYFTFYEEQENGSEVGFYVWFRQAATQEKISIRINREGVNTINWTSLVDQPEGSGTALYGRWFSLREPDGTTHGFWMNAGTVNESGYQGPVLSPWTAGIYDGSPGADIGAHPANIHSVDISSVMNGATDADNLTAIANLIESTIDGVSGLGSATRVVDGGNTYVDFIFTDAGVAYDAAYTSQGSLRTDHSQGGKSNNVFFTYTAGRSYDGKAVATSPTPSQVDLSALTEIRVDYSDGVGQGALAQLITTEINNKSGCDVTASYDAGTNSGIRVVLTNDRGGVVSNIADGTNNANVAGNGLNLQTGFTFNTSTQGVDAVPGGDFFAAGNKWNATNKKYGIMMLPKTDSGRSSTVNTYEDMIIQHTWPCSNSHSAIVDLIDPMHASLNILSITQSINFAHKGKYQTVTDRLGKSDIRKIGAMGGNIKFGGVDLNDNARAKFYSHQSKATPVYLDVKHTDGGFSRFYGVIISMSKDHPTGGVIPKFGLDMTCSHMISFDSTGSITSDGYISLGGNISEPTFV